MMISVLILCAKIAKINYNLRKYGEKTLFPQIIIPIFDIFHVIICGNRRKSAISADYNTIKTDTY